ncbi:MAG: hypothetical protein K6E61_05535 [Bacteroidales bacterium]|nr:hypothetical protein [Bacteroidales bacterium]
MKIYDGSEGPTARPSGKIVGFDITVTREGEEISKGRRGIMTKGDYSSYDSEEKLSTMDSDKAFGLIGIDYDHHALVVDNVSVNSHRYYSIPDEIEIGKQYVEVIYDVEGFDIGGFHYPPRLCLTGKPKFTRIMTFSK